MDRTVSSGRARRVALAALVLFYGVAGVGHLVWTGAMTRIVPGWLPFPHLVVIATGLCELAGAAALLVPRLRRVSGQAFALYAICVFPANITHALHDLGSGTGLPLGYHLPRLLLQPAIVWWALWASGVIDWPLQRRLAPVVRVP